MKELINLVIAIYFTNHKKRQLVEFLKEYPCMNVNFKHLHTNGTKRMNALTLKFSK